MFTVEVDASDFIGDLDAVKQGIADGKLMEAIGDMWTGSYIDEVFETEGAITGVKWPVTIRGEGILSDTGTMKKAFVSTVKGPELVISNTSKYFPTHELGMTIRAKNAPYLVFQLRGAGSTATTLGREGTDKQKKARLKSAKKRAEKSAAKAEASGDMFTAFMTRQSAESTGAWKRVKEVTIPQRSMLRVGDELRTRIGNEAAVWLNENWGKR